jgi:hypothetical protein
MIAAVINKNLRMTPPFDVCPASSSAERIILAHKKPPGTGPGGRSVWKMVRRFFPPRSWYQV